MIRSERAERACEKEVESPPLREGVRGRRHYRTPRLKMHGRVAELTRFGGSMVVDSGGGLGNLN